MYIGTVLLNRSEKQFWRMTPKKLDLLTKVHIRFNGETKEDEKPHGYIDSVF